MFECLADTWPADVDPFIIEHTPHIYVAGSQSRTASRLLHTDDYKTLLLSLAAFAEARQAVDVNLRTMHVNLVDCNADL